MELLNQSEQTRLAELEYLRSRIAELEAELTTIEQVARTINSALKLQEVFHVLVSQIHLAFGYETVSIYLCAEEGLMPQAQVGFEEGLPCLRWGQGITGRVALKGEAEFIADVATDPDFISIMPATRQLIVIPLKSRSSEVLGIIVVGSKGQVVLSEADFALLKVLGDQLSVAVENAHLLVELRTSQERYSLAVQGVNDGVWDWNIATSSLYLSERARAMLGYPATDINLTVKDMLALMHPDEKTNGKRALRDYLAGHTPHIEHEARMRHQDGSYRWILIRGCAVRDASGKPYRMAGSLTDITERKQAEQKLAQAALHDALTGLPNRMLFMNRLEQALHRSRQRRDYEFAVLFVDLDRFKLVNDSLGHDVGDQLLVGIARRLTNCLRPNDTVARMGGDEFSILVDGIKTPLEVNLVAERILDAFTKPFNLSGHEVFSSASIGIAFNSPDFSEPEDFLRSADMAMYRAKTTGKARASVFDSEMHAHTAALLRLETDLRRAIERQEFRLYYQPMVELASGRTLGFEGLLRWHHPERGIVSPDEFLSFAEESGLIIPISRWVLAEACHQAHEWQTAFGTALPVSINLSGKQLLRPDLPSLIAETLRDYNLDASNLSLEITEDQIMQNAKSSIVILSQLKDLGVKLYLDDFGTGYSSLSWLHQFPVDALKIDRAFISGLEKSEVIVKTIISLAHNLGMNVIAEGISTGEMAEKLTMLGCEYGQGYFFARPVAANAIAGWLNPVGV